MYTLIKDGRSLLASNDGLPCYIWNLIKGMLNLFEDNHQLFSHSSDDPHAAKSNFDTNQKKMLSEGVPGLWRQITNLLILVGIVAFFIILIKIL
ncbi:hypothetical protein D3C76_1349100 [compost metagenome]